MKTLFFASLALLLCCIAPDAIAAHFDHPTWNGYAVDWCRTFETDCGKPAADLFCQKHGYPASTSFVMNPAVHVETMTIGNNAVCDPRDHRCDSFSSIDCQELNIRTFAYPTYNGYRLDWCRTFEGDCGAPAAQAYCQHLGYPILVSFAMQPQVNVETMTIGNNAVCDPRDHRCDSFSYVRCRQP
jgi:hypothetical protein